MLPLLLLLPAWQLLTTTTDREAPAVEIIAHRGASYDAPENTLASIKLAWEQGADVAEFDIFLSKDNKIVVIHDANTKRTAGVDKPVVEQTLAELQKLDVGKWKDARFAGEPIPSLDQVLTTVPPGKRVFIEIKCGPEIVPELDQVLTTSKLKPEQTVIISFSADVVAAVKKARPDLTAYWIVTLSPKKAKPRTANELIAKAREIQADGLDLSADPSVLTPEFGKQVREAKLALYVWTVNDVDLARKMIQAGVQGITTDRPLWLREQLSK
jgi:glycerophosphoryl diester phosphodiesterase